MVVEMHVGGVRGIRAGEQGDEADEARSGTRNPNARCRCVAPRARNRGHRLAAYRQCSADASRPAGVIMIRRASVRTIIRVAAETFLFAVVFWGLVLVGPEFL